MALARWVAYSKISQEQSLDPKILHKLLQDLDQVSKQTFKREKKVASAGNRTRAARVAGEHSTTEPPMLLHRCAVISAYELVADNAYNI